MLAMVEYLRGESFLLEAEFVLKGESLRRGALEAIAGKSDAGRKKKTRIEGSRRLRKLFGYGEVAEAWRERGVAVATHGDGERGVLQRKERRR